MSLLLSIPKDLLKETFDSAAETIKDCLPSINLQKKEGERLSDVQFVEKSFALYTYRQVYAWLVGRIEDHLQVRCLELCCAFVGLSR